MSPELEGEEENHDQIQNRSMVILNPTQLRVIESPPVEGYWNPTQSMVIESHQSKVIEHRASQGLFNPHPVSGSWIFVAKAWFGKRLKNHWLHYKG